MGRYTLGAILLCAILFFFGYFVVEVACHFSRFTYKKTDMLRCVQMIFATLFTLFAGVFTLFLSWLSHLLPNPIVRDAILGYSGDFVKIITIGFFLVSGMCLVYTVILFVLYWQKYK